MSQENTPNQTDRATAEADRRPGPRMKPGENWRTLYVIHPVTFRAVERVFQGTGVQLWLKAGACADRIAEREQLRACRERSSAWWAVRRAGR